MQNLIYAQDTDLLHTCASQCKSDFQMEKWKNKKNKGVACKFRNGELVPRAQDSLILHCYNKKYYYYW